MVTCSYWQICLPAELWVKVPIYNEYKYQRMYQKKLWKCNLQYPDYEKWYNTSDPVFFNKICKKKWEREVKSVLKGIQRAASDEIRLQSVLKSIGP